MTKLSKLSDTIAIYVVLVTAASMFEARHCSVFE